MKRLADALYSIAIALWVGGMVGVGYVAVPVLFLRLADRSLAGFLAGDMFAIGGWIGIVCGGYLLTYLFRAHGRAALRNCVTRLVVLMLLLGMIGQFILQPIIDAIRMQALPMPVMQSTFAASFARWHGLSSVLYLLEFCLGIALVINQGKGKRALGAY